MTSALGAAVSTEMKGSAHGYFIAVTVNGRLTPMAVLIQALARFVLKSSCTLFLVSYRPRDFGRFFSFTFARGTRANSSFTFWALSVPSAANVTS
jgi:DNA-binding transcriptional MocR family regulator